MALNELLRNIRLVLNDDGSLRSVTGEFDEVDTASGRVVPKGTKRIRAADLAAILPNVAALIAAVDAANAERDEAVASIAAANAERDKALASVAAANAERDKALASVAAANPSTDGGDVVAAIERHVDSVARERDFDNAADVASYANSTVAQWAAEAGAFIAWRDAVWVYAYAELDKAEAGGGSQPAPSEIVAGLPTLDWPH